MYKSIWSFYIYLKVFSFLLLCTSSFPRFAAPMDCYGIIDFVTNCSSCFMFESTDISLKGYVMLMIVLQYSKVYCMERISKK